MPRSISSSTRARVTGSPPRRGAGILISSCSALTLRTDLERRKEWMAPLVLPPVTLTSRPRGPSTSTVSALLRQKRSEWIEGMVTLTESVDTIFPTIRPIIGSNQPESRSM
jgi:hypothetical protein